MEDVETDTSSTKSQLHTPLLLLWLSHIHTTPPLSSPQSQLTGISGLSPAVSISAKTAEGKYDKQRNHTATTASTSVELFHLSQHTSKPCLSESLAPKGQDQPRQGQQKAPKAPYLSCPATHHHIVCINIQKLPFHGVAVIQQEELLSLLWLL